MSTTNQIVRSAAGNDRTKTTRQLTREYFSNPPGGGAPLNKKPMISFTFDDGHVSNYTRAFPHFKANGFRATEFINGATIGVDSTRLTSQQIKEMSHAGWEMACHSYAHIDSTAVTNLELIDDLIQNKTVIEEIINKPVLTHGIPFGKYNESTLHMLSGIYEGARKTQKRYMSYGEVNNIHQCPGWFFDTLTLGEMKSAVDGLLAESEPKWLIVAMHGIGVEYNGALVSEGDLISLLEYVRNYAQSGLVDVVPFYEGVRRIIS